MNKNTTAMGLSIGRMLIGGAIALAPQKTLEGWIGPSAGEPGTKALGRAMGVRDFALGAATMGTLQATGTSGTGFKVLIGLGILCDGVDALATLENRPGMGPLALPSAAIALSAAGVGAALLAGKEREPTPAMA